MLRDLYQVDGAHREALLQLEDEAHRKDWYESYESVLPPKFDIYVGLETDATSLRTHEHNLVHGLLQTREYTHGGQPCGAS